MNSDHQHVIIRPAQPEDASAIWKILEPIIRAGETYALPREMSQAEAISYWMNPDRQTFVVEDQEVLGTYFIRPNNPGGGNHIANCGYATSIHSRGRGFARMMCKHSMELARAQGYRGMQFNFVISTNDGAVGLWKNLGFQVVGTLPQAFAHPKLGDVDVYVMFQKL